ncbi:MAG: FKBP-type peptidyl-prolyl cis-trans isomerase [Bacteroidales bacterium]|nr:FKBP-type peptidyl-prolyl cis-trans isomerase [Bacteroidales bacterium]
MKRLLTAAALLLLILAAGSCAKTTADSSNSAYDKVLASWVRVNYGKDVMPNDSGVYVLNFLQGSGKAVGDSSYVCAHYVRRDLSGNIKSTNYIDLCKQLGTFSEADYYGSDIWRVGFQSLPTGLEPIIRTMRVGGKATVAIPLAQSLVTNSGYNAFPSSETDNVIYEVEIDDVIDDIYEVQERQLKEFSAKYYGAMDTIAEGFYYKLVSETPGCDSIADESSVNVWYIGRRLDGTVFDTNIKDTAKKYRIYDASGSYEAMSVTYYTDLASFISNSSNIQGFTRALALMKYGDRAETFFNSNYGYGEGGSSTRIAEYAPLFFSIYIEPKE